MCRNHNTRGSQFGQIIVSMFIWVPYQAKMLRLSFAFALLRCKRSWMLFLYRVQRSVFLNLAGLQGDRSRCRILDTL